MGTFRCNSTMTDKPIIMFDTSAINRLAEDPSWDGLVVGIHTSFHVKLSLIVLQEMLATSCAKQREKFLKVCQALLKDGDCIFAFEPLLKEHIQAFELGEYSWLRVCVCSEWCRNKILENRDFTDEYSCELRSDGKEGNEKFKTLFKNIRVTLKNRYVGNGQSIEDNYEDFSSFVSSRFGNDGTYWVLAESCYKKSVGREPPKPVSNFVMACPPLYAYLLAIAYFEYQSCITSTPAVNQRKLPGLADVMMAAYLPYCHQFITNDEGQYQCFRTVLSELKLPVHVVRYEDFSKVYFR